MTRYNVFFTTTASYVIEVDAQNEDDAVEVAFDEAYFPYFPGGMDGDLGDDWEVTDIEEMN